MFNQTTAADEVALSLGQIASFANYSSFSKEINAIAIDLNRGTLLDILDAARDFVFRVGNDSSPGQWQVLTVQPTVRVVAVGGVDRILLTWPDGTIAKGWLQVTFRANEFTGLAVDDVFYFGNAIGEAGNSTSNALVDSNDELLARNNPRTFLDRAEITFPYDYNHDGFVNATDELTARNNNTTLASALKLIHAP